MNSYRFGADQRTELRKRGNKSSKSGFFGKLFKSNRREDSMNDYLTKAYLENMARNRAILYRNLQLNNWIYNPQTYSGKLADDDRLTFKLNTKSSLGANKTLDLNKLVSRAIKGNDALMDGSRQKAITNGALDKTSLVKLEEKRAGRLESRLGERPGKLLGEGSAAKEIRADRSNDGDPLTKDNLPSNSSARGLSYGPRRALNVRFNEASNRNSLPDELFLRSPERLRLPDRLEGTLSDQGDNEPIKNLVRSKWLVIKEFLFPPRPGQKREANRNVIYHSPISKPSAM